MDIKFALEKSTFIDQEVQPLTDQKRIEAS